MFNCPGKKCKGRQVPVLIKVVPDNEMPEGAVVIAYRVQCYMCRTQLKIISQAEYTAYLGPKQPKLEGNNPNAVPDTCYKCGMLCSHTVPPTSRLLYTWYGDGKFGPRKACLKCEPYAKLSTDNLIYLH